jgi:hypothetical protein
LNYRDRRIRISNKNLLEFIKQLAAGEFLIPTFQRLFVWEPETIRDLWDSIYERYPIGNILYWSTHTQLHVHRRLGGFYLPENGSDEGLRRSYILDGQQRATSLLASFFGGTGRVREHFSFDYTMYFDLKKGVFFFENEYYSHRCDAEAALLLRLTEVPELPPDFPEKLETVSGFAPSVRTNLEQLSYVFAAYSIPLVCLEGFDIGGVCAIYERINQTGMRLKNMDILIARGFKNYATVIEEDFPVAE